MKLAGLRQLRTARSAWHEVALTGERPGILVLAGSVSRKPDRLPWLDTTAWLFPADPEGHCTGAIRVLMAADMEFEVARGLTGRLVCSLWDVGSGVPPCQPAPLLFPQQATELEQRWRREVVYQEDGTAGLEFPEPLDLGGGLVVRAEIGDLRTRVVGYWGWFIQLWDLEEPPLLDGRRVTVQVNGVEDLHRILNGCLTAAHWGWAPQPLACAQAR